MARRKPKPAKHISSTRPEDRAKPAVRKRMSAPAMRTFFNIARRWGLDTQEQIALLGSPAASTFYKYKGGDVGTLSLDALTRISLVLGIFKNLRILFPDVALADRWVKLPNANPIFGGRTPAQFMAQGEMDSLYRVRRLLDARRGGWN
ncbi:MAG TPA: MbcA/ParS/Xre antitoxin family protein [Pseudolabrys sp.]|nr:MbcA/ParS/Xre antitoxin family protein [Pseudolabrys sp.]